MLIRAKDRRWLSSDVQSDLVLLCTDGAVPAHSALLAGRSAFLTSLLSQPSTLQCAGCSSSRKVTLAGVGHGECKALVELIYTGVAPLNTDVTKILELCGVLGMELDGLSVSNRGGIGELRLDADIIRGNTRLNSNTSLIDTTDTNISDTDTCMVNTNTSIEDNTNCDDTVDTVHHRFVTRSRSQSEESNPSVRVSGLTQRAVPGLGTKTPARTFPPPSPPTHKIVSPPPNSSPSSAMSPCYKDSENNPLSSLPSYPKTYFNRKHRLSGDSLAEPLKSFPLKKLPFKTPDISDNILPELPRYQELSRSSTPAVLQYLQSPQVMLPDTVLTEVMGMVPDVIKQEVEEVPDISCDVRDSVGEIAHLTDIEIGAEVTYGDGAENIHDLMDMVDPLRNTPDRPYPQLEGKGDDDHPNSPPVTSYLSMDNARNYVCSNCDQGFTFVRSFNWHRKKCQQNVSNNKKMEKKKDINEMNLDDLIKLENVEVKVVKLATKQCVICNKDVSGLKSHLSTVHFKRQILADYCCNTRQCKICKSPFKSVHGLVLHIGVHHNMVKKYLKDHLKAKKKKRIVLEKARPESPPEEKEDPAKDNMRISVVAEAKEKMRNKLVSRDKHKAKVVPVSKLKAVSKVVYKEQNKSIDKTASSRDLKHVEKSQTPVRNKLVPRVRTKVSYSKLHFGSSLHPSTETRPGSGSNKPRNSKTVTPTKTFKGKTVSRDSKPVNTRTEKKTARNNRQANNTKVLEGDKSTVKSSIAVSGGRKVSCGECVKCRLADCGTCIHCSDKPEFGGRGKLINRVCIKKVCRSKVWREVVVTPTLMKGSKVKR